MLSFFSLTILAIAAQALFAGVDAAVLPKRQSTPPSQGGGDLLDISAGLDLSSLIDIGPINIDLTVGLDDNLSTTIEEVISTVLDGLVDNVNVTVVIGQPSSIIGLALTLSGGDGAGDLDSSSILSPLIELLSEIISSVLGGGNFTIIPTSSTGSKVTLPTDTPSSGFPTGLPFPTGSLPSGPSSGFPSGFPIGFPFPTGSFSSPFPTESLPGFPSGFPTSLPIGLSTGVPAVPN